MKLKRLFTAVLSTALALSLCAMPAMAADGSTAAGTPNTSTIDKGQTGSITIYKRALDGETPGDPGKGEAMEAPGTALKDTGFTLYRVKDTEALLDYYNGLSTGAAAEVTVDSCFKDKTSYTKENLRTEISQAKVENEKFTDENGMAKFDGLKVGMYLVIETQAPQAVTVPVEPFLVSIPMTRIGDTAAGEQWLYDVTVYPKNSIAKGTVKLVKLGKQGDKTTKLADVQFTLYRKSDTKDEYTPVQTADPLVTDANGEIALKDLTKGRYYLQETGYTANNDKGYILNTTGKFYFDIDKNGKAVAATDPAITDTNKVSDASFTIDTTGTTLTVTNYKPDIKKTVTKRDGTADTHEADYGVGDDVQYTLTIKVPENVASLKTFKVTDTTVASQLLQKQESVKISGKNSAGTAVNEIAASSVTVTPDKNNSVMTVDFTPSTLAAVAGGEITITYTATVQSGAVVAGDGNVNTAQIVYSRTTNTEIDEGTDGNKPYEITDKGVVYTFALNIHKTGKGGTEGEKDLKGVTFDLYKKVDTEKTNDKNEYLFCGNPYTAINDTDAQKLGLNDSGATEKWIKVKTLTTGDDGKDGYASAKGLPSGTYKLVETKTVNGYNLLSKPVDAKLNLTYSEAWETKTTCDKNGNLTKRTIKTPTYEIDGKNVTPGEEIKIVNRAGFTLPVTGGFGTLLFSGIGVLLVLAGVGVLFSLKKKSNRA